jgi:hypothetical protein
LALNNKIHVTVENFKMALIGAGQIFGEEDAVFERPYSTSVICRSNQGFVFMIKSAEFTKKMRGNEESWRVITTNIKKKQRDFDTRLNKMD